MSGPRPPLLVPSLLWGGGHCDSLHKVPFHTLGTAKKRYLRLKPFQSDKNLDGSWIEVALVDNQTESTKKYYIVKAASPLSLIWSDPKDSSNNNAALLSSPFKKKARDNDHELLLQDIVQIAGGNRTSAFQAFIAKNGNWSVPNESCCFSLVSARRSVDFFIRSTVGNVDGRDAKLANAWRDSIQILLDNFHRKQHELTAPIRSISSSAVVARTSARSQRWNSKLHSDALFEAAKCGDLGTLRWFFDHGCPIDFMDAKTGDSVLMVACRLGLFDVARLALLGYNARNDVHPDWGQTALQVAVSAGHTSIVQLILETAEQSGADRLISNHEDENGEAPIHVAARCGGSTEIMELLVSHGANLGLVDGRGRTCLHCAAQAGQVSCLTFALDSGADEYLEVLSNEGFTPLHLAIRANKVECVKVLLEAGADVTAETAGGSNVYNLASKQRSERIMKLLVEYDVSEGDSSYDSYDETDDESEEDMFKGLNTYTVSPAKPPPSQLKGSLVSPSHPLNNYSWQAPSFGRGVGPYPLPTFPGGGAGPFQSHWSQVSHSPIGGTNHHYDVSVGNYSQHIFHNQQNHNRFNPSYVGSEEMVGEQNHFEAGEFHQGGETWKIYITHDGHPYFYNVNQDSSTWDDPRATAESVSIAEPRVHTPQQITFDETQSRQTLSYRKKLTAIPQTPIRAVQNPSAENIVQARGILNESQTRALPSPNVPVSAPHKVEIDRAVNQHPLIENADQANETFDARCDRSMLQCSELNQTSRINSIESNSANMLTSVSPSTGQLSMNSQAEIEEVDPKTMLLAQIRSRNMRNGSNGKMKNSIPAERSSSTDSKSDTKTMLLSQISHADGSTSGAKQSASTKATQSVTTNNSNAVQSGSTNCDKGTDMIRTKPTKEIFTDDPAMAKYMKMRAVGIPAASIIHKMTQDGIEVAKIQSFRTLNTAGDEVVAPSTKVDTNSNAVKVLSPKRQSKDQMRKSLMQDEAVKKFMRMVDVGVPAQAAVHKMKQDGVDEKKIDMFKQLHGLVTAPALPMPPPQKSSTKQKYARITKQDLAKDGTFKKYVKMSTVGVPLMAIVTKMSQDGVEQERIHMFSAAFGLNVPSEGSPKPFPMPPMHHERRRASKALQKIHWTTVAEERLQNSIWASNSNADDDIEDCEIEKLESLFSASPVNKASGVGRKQSTAKNNNAKKPSSLIDPKRANNIAISLAQFRAFSNFDDLCQAVASLDGEHLNIEKLQNMQLLLPKPEELNKLKHFVGQSDSLGRAEKFFLSVMKIPLFPAKLAAFKYSLQFDEQAESLTSSLRLLGEACGEVIASTKLATILKRLLAIGNIMNESAGKPKAAGVTLDSLIKTAKKKGSDGKTTVLDHLINTAMNNKLDFVEFWSDMPTVRDAMRLNLDDFRLLLRECESGAQSVSRTIEKEKSEAECQGGSSGKDTFTEFLHKLQPFLKRALIEIEKIKKLFGDVEKKVQLLCSFFAEDFKTCKASTIFGVLLEFSRLVDKSKEQYHRKVKAAKRRESMAKNR